MIKRNLAISFIAFALIVPNVYADDHCPPPMNQIQLQVAKEMWAKTSAAKVVVTLDAIQDSSGMVSTHNTLNDKLKQISNKGEWHITSFNRYKDSSELEKINAVAEARLPESELPGLRDRAKKISVPGRTFTISGIDFTPSMADVQQTHALVREAIYQDATQELARINKELGGGYFIHQINFVQDQPIPEPRLYKQQNRAMTMEVASPVAANVLTISDKVTLSATILIASKP